MPAQSAELPTRLSLAALVALFACHSPDDVAHLDITSLRASFTHVPGTGGGSNAVVEFVWSNAQGHCLTIDDVTVTLGGVEMAGDQLALGGIGDKEICNDSARYTLLAQSAPTKRGVQELVIADKSGQKSVNIDSPYRPHHIVPEGRIGDLHAGDVLTFQSAEGMQFEYASVEFMTSDRSGGFGADVSVAGDRFQVAVPYVPAGVYYLTAAAGADAIVDCPFTTCIGSISTEPFFKEVQVVE